MTWWADFDADEVDEEFAIIADIGMTMVRIFLFWEDWQPSPNTVDPRSLANLGVVADIAAELGLQLDVTFFTGHMSGPNWAPPWMLLLDEPMPDNVNQVISGGQVVDCGVRNPFEDPVALEAERLLLSTVVTRYKDHPAIGIWNLGNEPDNFAWPTSRRAGTAWAEQMTSLIKSIDPRHPVTCGLHVESLQRDNGLWVGDIFSAVDIAVMHGYPMYSDWSTGDLDPWFVPFMCALTSAFCGKRTMAEEFGACTEAPGNASTTWEWTAFGRRRTQFMASEDDFAGYLGQVLANLLAVGSTGAMLWCFADYAEELWSSPPCDEAIHERFFGLVRPDGSLKPHAEVVRRFAGTLPTVQPPVRGVHLDVSEEEFYRTPRLHVERLYRDWLNQYGA
jgi:endo-1,4-beta-mannosidase